VKPGYPKHKKTRRVSREARLLNIHLWNLADDEGRLQELPQWIIGEVFPTDEDVTPVVLREWLQELSDAGLIVRYEVEDERYIQCHDFLDHQVISHPTKSIIPAPQAGAGLPPEPSVDPPGGPVESLRPEVEVEREEEMEVEWESEAGAPDSTRSTSSSASERESAPEIVAVCEVLADLIESNGSKRPSVAQVKGWRKDARLMIEQDGRTVEQIEAAMQWAHNHPAGAGGFSWRSVILSMGKLREKFDQLRLQAQAEKSSATGTTTEHPADRRIRELREEADRLDDDDAPGSVAA